MIRLRSVAGFALLLASAASLQLSAQTRLSPLFSDHAVLQRDRPLPVFGRGTPGDALTIALGMESAKTTVGPDGNVVRDAAGHALRWPV